MIPDLRKCPVLLCGGEAELDVRYVDEDLQIPYRCCIRCKRCGAQTQWDGCGGKPLADMVSDWNGPAPQVVTRVTRSEHILLSPSVQSQLRGKGYVVYGTMEEPKP